MSGPLHVTSQELTDAAAGLRGLALRLIANLLDDDRYVPLQKWLTRDEARVFDRMPLSRLGWRRAIVRVSSRFGARVLPAATDIRTPIETNPGEIWSESMAAERLALEWHGRMGLVIPPRLLRLVGDCAWSSPRFRFAAAAILGNHLRERLVVPLTQLPVARVEPALMWLLIASSPVRLPILVRLRLLHRRQRSAVGELRRAADEILQSTPLPAPDFWTQWIVWHLLRRNRPVPESWRSYVEGFHRSPADAVGSPATPVSTQSFVDMQIQVIPAIYNEWYAAKGVKTCSIAKRFARFVISISTRFARSR
jgi:hypothetical protein